MAVYQKGLLFIDEGGHCYVTQQKPDIYNLGDDLCSPRHYYDFLAQTPTSAMVVGGGVFTDFGYQCLKMKSADINIIWGFGLSRPLEIKDNESFLKKTIKKIKLTYKRSVVEQKYHFRSSRDPLVVALGYPFVPCPSCFHAITDLPIKNNGVGVIINANPDTHGAEVEDSLRGLRKRFPDVIFATNDMTQAQAMVFFGQVDKIITNSYHFAYWALLSGRHIDVIAYSTKFKGLLELFNLTTYRSYKKQDAQSLINHLESALQSPNWIHAADYEVLKKEFRSLNNDFAKNISALSSLTVRLKEPFRSRD
ncbi:MAG: hypothetical protein QG557_1119 [Pseudomonadota bacterium]|nr:hypothetical protein [Pseudomonadota bacterium]